MSSLPIPEHAPAPPHTPLRMREIAATWAPLAGSWLLMGLELPAVSAVMARLPEATVSLAAYGGVVFPLALIIESPIVMLLAGSTALARDRASYHLIRRFMFATAGALTLLHVLIAFTPLFDVVAGGILGVPEVVREPARLGLRILLPWTLAIAYRRTQQGVLIRFGRAHSVTYGTAVRLATNVVVLGAGAAYGQAPGIAVGCAAIACGVTAEALYAGWAVRPVLRGALRSAPAVTPALTNAAFLRFYLPLAATPFINFLAMPMASAAMSRMPLTIESLAVWPVLSGITFTLRSLGFAYNEVVVAKLDAWRPVPALRRFGLLLGLGSSAVLAVGVATPLGGYWFGTVSGLTPPLAALATTALWLMIPLPALSAWQSWYQGALVHSRNTRGVTESVLVLLVATALVLAAGVARQPVPGIYFASLALVAGNVAQAAWLAWRARGEIANVSARDHAEAPA